MLELLDPKVAKKIGKINNIVYDAHIELLNFWKSEIIYDWHWWVNLGLSILPWVLWIYG